MRGGDRRRTGEYLKRGGRRHAFHCVQAEVTGCFQSAIVASVTARRVRLSSVASAPCGYAGLTVSQLVSQLKPERNRVAIINDDGVETGNSRPTLDRRDDSVAVANFRATLNPSDKRGTDDALMDEVLPLIKHPARWAGILAEKTKCRRYGLPMLSWWFLSALGV